MHQSVMLMLYFICWKSDREDKNGTPEQTAPRHPREDYNNTGALLKRHEYHTSCALCWLLLKGKELVTHTHTHTHTHSASFISLQTYSNKLWWSDQGQIKICPIKLDAGNVAGKWGTFIEVINFPCRASGWAYKVFETWRAARPPEHEMNSQD